MIAVVGFDQETAEALAPVLAMVGQQASVDRNWTCSMVDAVAADILPEFHRQRRNSASSPDERIGYGLKLVANSSGRADDIAELAHAYADSEQLDDALYWITKAIQLLPADGELHRFKASILERIGLLDQALEVARRAEALGADPDAIRTDIDRIDARWMSLLTENSLSADLQRALPSSAILIQSGRMRFSAIASIILRVIKLYTKARRTNLALSAMIS